MSQEHKVFQSVKRMFQAISLSYIIRHYIWGLLFLFLYSQLLSNEPVGVYEWICLLCYPFSRFVFDEVVGFLAGDGGGVFWLLSVKWFFFLKLIIITFVFLFAPLVAPLGFLYLHIRVNVLKK